MAAQPEAGGDGESGVEQKILRVGVAHHGVRADKCLADSLPEFSRSYLQQLMAQGDATLNGVPFSKASVKVKSGDSITVVLRPTDQARSFKAEAMHLDIVHEDDALLVVNKPAGLVVHPAAGHWSGTLMNGLLHHWPGAADLPRAGIVHRLDKDTSGLMVVAKTRITMEALVRLIAQREVRRFYLALCENPWRRSGLVSVDLPIGRDPANRLRMAVARGEGSGAKPAKTQFVAVGAGANLTLLACKLFTGRTHQIRVHLSSLGCPILGDQVYGGRPGFGMNRQALHATRLAFDHPVSGQPMAFFAELPEDLTSALNGEGLNYNAQLLDASVFAELNH